MTGLDGSPGQLIEIFIDTADDPAPQLRAVVITLLIKSLDDPHEQEMTELMISSDRAGALIDRPAAEASTRRLRLLLRRRMVELAAQHGESWVVRMLRDHLLAQIERWARRSVDDAENRRRAERFLAWADRPEALASAQRRGLFLGMTADDLRDMARDQAETPVSAETAMSLWTLAESWKARAELQLGDGVIAGWEAQRGN